MGFSLLKAYLHTPALHANNTDKTTRFPKPPRKFPLGGSSRWSSTGCPQPLRREGRSWKASTEAWKARALPDWHAVSDWPLMAVMIEHIAGQRDYVVHKSVWHMSDGTLKNIYTGYIMFTCWGCCFFGSTKDPFYDGEQYRKDGGDGTVNWLYEKQEDIEESARAELWREELIEEIEQKVGGLRELEEAGKQEELVK